MLLNCCCISANVQVITVILIVFVPVTLKLALFVVVLQGFDEVIRLHQTLGRAGSDTPNFRVEHLKKQLKSDPIPTLAN